MVECLEALQREQIGSQCPVVDHELVASSAGSPDDVCVWFICRNEAEKRLFIDTEQSRYVSALKQKMIAAGLSESAVSSLTTRVTSREEVEASGGRFDFFR
jgi:hypothetical protein